MAGTASLRGRNISLDIYFTSLSIAEWCLDKDITITGTLRKDRIGLPREMKVGDGREAKSTMWCFAGKKNADFVRRQEEKGNENSSCVINHAR